MRSLIEKLTAISEDRPTVGDGVYLEFGNLLQVDTEIMEMSGDSITLLGDEKLFAVLESLNEIESCKIDEANSYGLANTPTIRHKIATQFTHDSERAATKYKPNKYDPVTGLGGYISSHAQSNEKLNNNIVNQIKRNLDTAIGKPLEFENGDTLEINPMIAKKALAKIENMKPQPRHEAIKSIMQSKANFVRFMGESVVEGEVISMQNNHQTLKRLAKMWWHGDEGKHAQAVKILSNMGWDIAEDDDDIVLNKDGKEVRFFMDDLYESLVAEAEYHGRKVALGKPMRGDVKKFKVFVKDPKTGNVKKVNFGDPNMRIKKSNPKRRKSFRARHHCSNPGPRTKARYWSCRKW